jgi:hypothetical protein
MRDPDFAEHGLAVLGGVRNIAHVDFEKFDVVLG